MGADAQSLIVIVPVHHGAVNRPEVFFSPSSAERYWERVYREGYRYCRDGSVWPWAVAKKQDYLSTAGADDELHRYVLEVWA